MGALTDTRKRFSLYLSSPSASPLKKSKLPDQRFPLLKRPLHGPQRIVRVFGRGSGGKSSPQSFIPRKRESLMGNAVSWVAKEAIPLLGSLWNTHREMETLQTPKIGNLVRLELLEYKKLVSSAKDDRSLSGDGNFREKTPLKVTFCPSSVRIIEEEVQKIELSPFKEVIVEATRTPLYKDLLASARKRDDRISSLEFEVKVTEKKYSELHEMPGDREKGISAPFRPLTDEEEGAVSFALGDSDEFWSNKHEVLVVHEGSNIEITREVIQCLRPCAWLNDEVINLYLALLKERERREPNKFLSCHFFNTFFYKKLTGGRNSYDFKAVRRWTSQRKLGYGIIECDKIFVPIHKEVHWCLAMIDMKDKKFIYLDSLGGFDDYPLQVLARYIVDEVKDKSNEIIDVSSWDHGTVDNLPLQENGWDCGMFMVKYSDFFSRGLTIHFTQDDMEYFRRRTANEILNLRAE